MDEITLGGATMIGELRDGELREYDIHSEEFGFAMAGSQNLRVNDAAESRTRVLEALANTLGVARDIVVFNRSEESSVGIECASTCRIWWLPSNYKINIVYILHRDTFLHCNTF